MLSIIIANYKQPELLRLCLKNIQKTLSSDFKYEIIVVDSAATIETQNIVTDEFPEVKYVPYKKNVGYTYMVNEGISQALGDAFFIINSDIVPLRGSIEKMYVYLKSDSSIGLIGPQLLNFDGTIQQSCFRYYTPLTIVYRRTPLGWFSFGKKILAKFYMNDHDLTKPTTTDWLLGSALMGDTVTAKKIGLMDKNLYLYMSDVDWPRRFWENGFQVIYYPLSRMYHYHHRHSRSWLGMFDAFFNHQTHQHIVDAIKYFAKYGLGYRTYVN